MVNYQYPGTIVDMNNVLSNHKFDTNKHKNRIISIQRQKIIRRIKREKKSLYYHLRKWKGGAPIAENRGTNLPNAELNTRFQNMSWRWTRLNSTHIKRLMTIKSRVEAFYKARKKIRWFSGQDFTVHLCQQQIWKKWYYWTVTPERQSSATWSTYKTYKIRIIHWESIQ